MCACINCICLACMLILFITFVQSSSLPNKLLHQHPDPESVAREFQWKTNQSMARRIDVDSSLASTCRTGNPIDDCWRCDPDWEANRQRLADCAIGFGQGAGGGRGGQYYVVTDPSDNNPENPAPGTLRHGATQAEPLWIVFSGDMQIRLKTELVVSSQTTIDGRGADVHVAGGACLQIHSVRNVIVHGLNIHHCVAVKGDGDGVSIMGSAAVWVDHCSLSYCADGLIDVTLGSTAITISNNYLSHHDKVMLLGHNDDYKADMGMQVTVAFNRFGEHLVERMPRCRHGYFHIVNNDYLQWGMYAIGGSANPTINSQGNRFLAPSDPNSKQVTMRMDAKESEWRRWNWRSEGDLMLNGAFFVPSGAGAAYIYGKASSLEPRPAAYIEQMTINSGVTGASRGVAVGVGNQGQGSGGGGGLITGVGPGDGYDGAGQGGGYSWGMMFGSGSTSSTPKLVSHLVLFITFVLFFVPHFN